MANRFVLEVTHSSTHGVVHREMLVQDQIKQRFDKIKSIKLSDRTTLTLSIRDAVPHERIKKLLTYRKVLHKAAALGLSGENVTVEGF